MELDLVSMFRLSDGAGDGLSHAELMDVLSTNDPWDRETGPSVWVSLYPTRAGEALYYEDEEI